MSFWQLTNLHRNVAICYFHSLSRCETFNFRINFDFKLWIGQLTANRTLMNKIFVMNSPTYYYCSHFIIAILKEYISPFVQKMLNQNNFSNASQSDQDFLIFGTITSVAFFSKFVQLQINAIVFLFILYAVTWTFF